MPQELWTIRDVLGWTRERFARAGLGSPRLEAEVLLAHALSCDRVTLYTDHHRPLSAEERARYRELVARRLAHHPTAHLVGHREFWSRRFRVTPSVLIPRPETETLVADALERLAPLSSPRVLDVGTGSGAIAVTLAAERPDAFVAATDLSAEAISVAQDNAAAHDARVTFFQGDLLDALPSGTPPFDLVVANLPYISPLERGQLQPEVLREPASALFSAPDGLTLIRRLAAEAIAGPLRSGGWIVLEVGATQARSVLDLLTEQGYDRAASRADLAGLDRVVAGRRPGAATAPG